MSVPVLVLKKGEEKFYFVLDTVKDIFKFGIKKNGKL